MPSPLPELERRCQELDVTHAHYREEMPLVLEYLGWDNDNMAELEQRLGDREADRQWG